MGIGDWIAVVGIAIVIYQIFRTGSMVKATKDSVEMAARQLGVYSLLILISELCLLERDLERVVDREDRAETTRLLKEWQAKASELRGLLRNDIGINDEFAAQVQASITLATNARALIKKDKDVRTSTLRVRDACEHVCLEAHSLGAQIRSSAPESPPTHTLWSDFIELYGRRPKNVKELENVDQ